MTKTGPNNASGVAWPSVSVFFSLFLLGFETSRVPRLPYTLCRNFGLTPGFLPPTTMFDALTRSALGWHRVARHLTSAGCLCFQCHVAAFDLPHTFSTARHTVEAVARMPDIEGNVEELEEARWDSTSIYYWYYRSITYFYIHTHQIPMTRVPIGL